MVDGLSSDPTIEDGTKIVQGSGLGEFTAKLENLEKFMEYNVRAYAINEAGVAYGENLKFTTLADIRTWNIPGNYVEASYPGAGLGNWSPDKSPQVFSTVTGTDGPNYGSNDGQTLDANAGNIQSPSGYYKLNVDALANTYTAVATVWGVIGSATPGDWGDETPMTYNPAQKQWQGGFTLKQAEFKFRANHSWDYNYGSDNNDGKLQAGGKNIPIDQENDYAITLDLSKPNEYTYSAYRWGLIGDATPGGWSDDTDMKWDASKRVFTVTLDLSAKQFKFRANDGWDVNYGGDLNSLTPGGDNISVSEDGNYTITLDPWAKKATVTKN